MDQYHCRLRSCLEDKAGEEKRIMKNIVCYGDSNTYGYNPVNGLRYPKNVRWTGKLQEALGEEYVVIEEGCNGRTTVFKDPIDGWKNGLDYLKPCLNTHKPVDMVIMMLGSNDLKKVYQASSDMIAKGVERLLQEIYDFADTKQNFRPEVILLAPPVIGADIVNVSPACAFDESAIARSKELGSLYKELADRYGCFFLNTADCIESSKEDCLHLMPEAHKKLAKVLAKLINDEVSQKLQVRTKRLKMRPYNLEEMKALKENEQDKEMQKAYGEMIDCMVANQGKEYWGAAWEIALHDGTRVGDFCFKGAPDEAGEVEIGYGIDEPMQRNGYATEMVAAMLHWAMVQPGVKAVTAETEPDNKISQKVLYSNGFIQKGYGEEGPRFLYNPWV